MKSPLTWMAALAASVALAGCWGGSDDDTTVTPPPTTTPTATAVPDSALSSSTAFISYLNGLSLTDETSEALTLPAGDAPTSETDEPAAVT